MPIKKLPKSKIIIRQNKTKSLSTINILFFKTKITIYLYLRLQMKETGNSCRFSRSPDPKKETGKHLAMHPCFNRWLTHHRST